MDMIQPQAEGKQLPDDGFKLLVDSFTEKTLPSFEKELAHIETFVRSEKRRVTSLVLCDMGQQALDNIRKNITEKNLGNDEECKEKKYEKCGNIPVRLRLKKGPREIKIVSFNILAQHLVDGEQPSYKQVNDNNNPRLLLNIRLNKFKEILKAITMSDFDIFNLQEIGRLDGELIDNVLKELNEKQNVADSYKVIIADQPTGSQGLKIGTIYNCNTLELKDTKHFNLGKEGKPAQFAMILRFKHQLLGEFVSINVHFCGGVSQKDIDQRKEQILHLQQESCWLDQNLPIILGGDFNTELKDFMGQVKGIDKNLAYIFDGKDSLMYNSENRIQERNRSGWAGIQIIERNVDAIFYRKPFFDLKEEMILSEEFPALLNKPLLEQRKRELKEIEQIKDEEIKKQELNKFSQLLKSKDQPETGFPNEHWFSDHLPVGAIFSINR